VVLADSPNPSRRSDYSGNRQHRPSSFGYGTLTPYGRPSQTVRLKSGFLTAPGHRNTPLPAPTTPAMQRSRPITHSRFRLFPVRSPLLGESFLLSSPPATKMFQFTGLPRSCLWIQHAVTRLHPGRVTPFGFIRIYARRQLPVHYRGLPRPSSADGA